MLTATEDLLDEVVTEFGDLVEVASIGEQTNDGRSIKQVRFKELLVSDEEAPSIFSLMGPTMPAR